MFTTAAEVSIRRIALLLEYEGTHYAGSQYQKNAPTIQAALEQAMRSLTDESIRVALAGRTDTGVHARGQVASFLTASRYSPNVFVRGLNHYLPEDIAVRATAEVPLPFDVRRQARRRWYRYTICHRGPRLALRRRYAWHREQALDLEATQQAARYLEGEHDFAAFTQPSLKRRQNTVRQVYRSQVTPRGSLLLLDMEANAFLPQQVRRSVGALVQVGGGQRSLAQFRQLVEEAPPGAASFVAPPHGLCLMQVCYDINLFGNETYENL